MQLHRSNINLLRTGLVDISTTSVSYYFGIVSGVILYVEYSKHSFIILKSIFDLEINISRDKNACNAYKNVEISFLD